MNLLPFIVAGVASGAVYGLAGVGLVLTYKTSGIFNFAHGTIATVSAFLFYWLHIQHHLDWRVSALLSLLIAGPVLGVALERLARAATSSPLGVRVVATIGLLTFIQAAVVIRFGTQYHTVPGFLGSGTFHIGDTVVTYAQVIILVLAVVATAGLYAYFRVSRGGVAMRAVVDDPDLLDMMGTNPVAVRRRAWVIGATFASVSGILLVQLLGQVDSITLTLLVVQAFGAAALGRFKNLPVTFIGGISLGVGTSLCTKYFQRGLSSGLAASLPFIVLIVVLLITPKQSLAERPFIIRRTRAAWRAPGSIQITGAVLIGGFLLFLPHFAGLHLDSWTAFLTNVIMFLSLGLLVRTSGQVSLSQVSFLAIGVSAFSHLLVDKHVPWLLALILTGLIAVPIGAMLAIPAIRLSGLYLALVSLGSGILLQYMFYSQRYMFGSSGFGLKVPRPHVSWLHVSSDRGYYYLVLALTVLIAALLVALIRGRLGRLLRALATSPTGLSTSGTSVNITRVLVFCMAAFIAAIAGALGGGVNGVVSADSYPPLLSLTYFVVITITVGGEPWFALFAALGLNVIPIYFHNKNITNYLMLLFGLFAMLYVMTPPDKRGIPESVTRVIDRIGRRRVKAPIDVVEEPAANTIAPMSVALTQAPEAEPAIATPLLGDCALEVTNLRVQFGGLIALDGVSLRAPAGRITGLIGPNGAGKTTLFNACSGLNQPRVGSVQVDGRSLLRLGASARARLGLGRTFQQMQLFDDLTVAENVAIGREGGFAGYNPFGHLTSTPRQRQIVRAETQQAITLCGLESIAGRPAGVLSTGQRRLVELARCLAGPFRILLLDEPSSGLDHKETERFGSILQRVVEERGVGILLVEHDLSLVTAVCDYIYVLDFGRTLFEGTPGEVLRSPAVQAAYLGESTVDHLEPTAPDCVAPEPAVGADSTAEMAR